MPALRFVFPHAPVRPSPSTTVTDAGQYDLIGIDRRSPRTSRALENPPMPLAG
jgi:hypothetical protein